METGVVTGAEPAFFFDWDGNHVAVPCDRLLERSRRLLRKTTFATRCLTAVLRRLCGLRLQNMMANSMSRMAVCVVGLYASRRGTSFGLHRLEAGEVVLFVRVPHGKACGSLREFCPCLVVRLPLIFGTASARLKRVEVVKQLWPEGEGCARQEEVDARVMAPVHYSCSRRLRRWEDVVMDVYVCNAASRVGGRPSALVRGLRDEEEVALKGRCVPAAAGPHPDVVHGGDV